VFFFSSCSKDIQRSAQFSPEDKQWLTKLFEDLLFVENGIYTLWGSKPITEIVMYHYSEEEWNRINREISPKELENCYVCDSYDLPENWNRWEKLSLGSHLNDFILFRSHFSEDEKVSFVYLVNILATSLIIQKNFELFRNAVGFPFHPLEVVLEMSDPASRFGELSGHLRKLPFCGGFFLDMEKKMP
jgi:hypothetical protein